MKTGAIITVAGGVGERDGENNLQYVAPAMGGKSFACYELLGETLLQRTLNSLTSCEIVDHTVLYEEADSESIFPSRGPAVGKFFSEWEAAVDEQLNQGVETLILIRLGAYLELNFSDLLSSHAQASGGLTQVYDTKSAFEIAVVNADKLRGEKGSYRGRLSALVPYHRRYKFAGYSNRLREPQDFRKLAQDALLGRNSIKPLGKEVGPGIWMGEGASIDPSARISAPAYVGAHTNVKGSCLINGVTNIERDCKVDFGTTVTDSSVLPESYLGMGLNFTHAVVAPDRLFNLERNVEVQIVDRNLLGKHRSLRTFTKSIGQKGFFNRGLRQLNQVDAHL